MFIKSSNIIREKLHFSLKVKNVADIEFNDPILYNAMREE